MQAINGGLGLRETSTVTALYSPTEGQGSDESTPTSETTAEGPLLPATPLDPSGTDSSALARFVLGIDAALGRTPALVAAVAPRDARELDEDRPARDLAQLDPRTNGRVLDPDVEAAAGAVDEVLRLFLSSDGASPTANATEPKPSAPAPRSQPATEFEEIDAPVRDDRAGMIPAVSAALLLSTRLILSVSPPRPSSFRRKAGLKPYAGAWWMDRSKASPSAGFLPTSNPSSPS